MTVTTPPRRPAIEQDRDLEQRVADLEALIEEARRRARLRRRRHAAAALLLFAAGAAIFIGFGGHGGGTGSAVLEHAPGLPSAAASAGSPPLGALPPDAGGVQAVAFDPRNPRIVYVLTVGGDAASTGHVFKTTDGGAHWHTTATSGGGWVGDIQALTADPRHPGTLYAGTTVAVYKTVDGGRSWRPFNQGLFPPHGGRQVCSRAAGGRSYCVKQPFGTAGTPHFNRSNGWVTAIAVDPANTNIVYSGADAVRKSTDGGHTWKTVFLPQRAWAANVSALAIAATRPESIYAVANRSDGRTSHGSIYKSTDAGKTWRATGGPGSVFTNQDGWGGALAVDPQHPTTVYASIGRTLVRTTDAGASWQPITQGLPQQVVTALTVDPRQSGTAYVGLYPTYTNKVISAPGGIYKTTNGGDTWAPAFPDITPGALAVDPARPTTIYAALNGRKERIARSTDGGRTWTTAP